MPPFAPGQLGRRPLGWQSTAAGDPPPPLRHGRAFCRPPQPRVTLAWVRPDPARARALPLHHSPRPEWPSHLSPASPAPPRAAIAIEVHAPSPNRLLFSLQWITHGVRSTPNPGAGRIDPRSAGFGKLRRPPIVRRRGTEVSGAFHRRHRPQATLAVRSEVYGRD